MRSFTIKEYSRTATMTYLSFLLSLFLLILCGTSFGLKPIYDRSLQRRLRSKELRSIDPKLYNPLMPYSDQLVPLVPTSPDYVYVPPEVGTEIYLGSIIAVLPIAWGAVEFYKRVKTQQECLLCTGSGLVYNTRQGNKLTRPRKCWSCGGFIPWLGWKMVMTIDQSDHTTRTQIHT